MASTGQGWEQIRSEWDIPRLEAWNKYTADHPPLHLMVAAYFGIKPQPKAAAPELVQELQTFPGAMQMAAFDRPIRRDLMPWLKKT